MITKFHDFVIEGLFNFNKNIDKEWFDLEDKFEPNEPFLKRLYRKEMVDLYKDHPNRYKLVLKVLKANQEANNKDNKKSKELKKPTFSFFRSLLKLSESELRAFLTTWENHEEWY